MGTTGGVTGVGVIGVVPGLRGFLFRRPRGPTGRRPRGPTGRARTVGGSRISSYPGSGVAALFVTAVGTGSSTLGRIR